jgi:hypothetical protein
MLEDVDEVFALRVGELESAVVGLELEEEDDVDPKVVVSQRDL